ncbi:MAG: Mov34/MPN/PAD-1 family protein [Sandarakinorhabdus sp.]|jgi:proteasome lid subunit RPN8/RPN11
MKLQISSAHQQFLLDAAAASPDAEICGLLLGQPGRVEQLVPAQNVAANPARSFEIAPETLLASHRNARGAGQKVIGHWHSHPGGTCAPSSRDAARATDNGQIWLIIAGGAIGAWAAQTQAAGPATFEPVALVA